MQPHEPVQNHTMHAEQICVTLDFLMALQKNILENKKIIAVGTTAVRTLESLYHLGLMTAAGTPPDFLGQWQAYQPQQPPTTTAAALQHLIHHLQSNQQNQLIAHTQIMIVPGFKFNICDAIITNFHQPQSTLLCLVAAFVGSKNSNTWQNIYTHALQNNYRFLSYGDSSLLYKST
jgi:S-adenosylmethionine:tRNA ribosyltransferase-isomerase